MNTNDDVKITKIKKNDGTIEVQVTFIPDTKNLSEDEKKKKPKPRNKKDLTKEEQDYVNDLIINDKLTANLSKKDIESINYIKESNEKLVEKIFEQTRLVPSIWGIGAYEKYHRTMLGLATAPLSDFVLDELPNLVKDNEKAINASKQISKIKTGDWKGLFDHLKYVASLLTSTKEIGKTLVGWVREVVNWIIETALIPIAKLLEPLINSVSDTMGWLINLIKDILPDLIAIVSTAIGDVLPVVSTVLNGGKFAYDFFNWFFAAKSSYTLRTKEELVQEGGAMNALHALQFFQDRKTAMLTIDTVRSGAVFTTSIVTDAAIAGDYGGSSAIVKPIVAAVNALVGISQLIFRVGQDIYFAFRGNAALANRQYSTLFEDCPILGLYYLACAPTSAIVKLDYELEKGDYKKQLFDRYEALYKNEYSDISKSVVNKAKAFIADYPFELVYIGKEDVDVKDVFPLENLIENSSEMAKQKPTEHFMKFMIDRNYVIQLVSAKSGKGHITRLAKTSMPFLIKKMFENDGIGKRSWEKPTTSKKYRGLVRGEIWGAVKEPLNRTHIEIWIRALLHKNNYKVLKKWSKDALLYDSLHFLKAAERYDDCAYGGDRDYADEFAQKIVAQCLLQNAPNEIPVYGQTRNALVQKIRNDKGVGDFPVGLFWPLWREVFSLLHTTCFVQVASKSARVKFDELLSVAVCPVCTLDYAHQMTHSVLLMAAMNMTLSCNADYFARFCDEYPGSQQRQKSLKHLKSYLDAYKAGLGTRGALIREQYTCAQIESLFPIPNPIQQDLQRQTSAMSLAFVGFQYHVIACALGELSAQQFQEWALLLGCGLCHRKQLIKDPSQ